MSATSVPMAPTPQDAMAADPRRWLMLAVATLLGQSIPAEASVLERLGHVTLGLVSGTLVCLPLLPRLRRTAMAYLVRRRPWRRIWRPA